MKLHLPQALRRSLLHSLAAIGSVLGAAVPVAGGVAAALALPSMAETLTHDFADGGTISNLDYAHYELLTVSGGTLLNVEANGCIHTTNGAVGLFSGEHTVAVGSLMADGLKGGYTMMSSAQLNGLVLGGDACFTVDLSGLTAEMQGDIMLGLTFTGLSVSNATTLSLEETSWAAHFELAGAEGLRLERVESVGGNTVLYIQGNLAAIPKPTTAAGNFAGRRGDSKYPPHRWARRRKCVIFGSSLSTDL